MKICLWSVNHLKEKNGNPEAILVQQSRKLKPYSLFFFLLLSLSELVFLGYFECSFHSCQDSRTRWLYAVGIMWITPTFGAVTGDWVSTKPRFMVAPARTPRVPSVGMGSTTPRVQTGGLRVIFWMVLCQILLSQLLRHATGTRETCSRIFSFLESGNKHSPRNGF